jgi:hypothetical protein
MAPLEYMQICNNVTFGIYALLQIMSPLEYMRYYKFCHLWDICVMSPLEYMRYYKLWHLIIICAIQLCHRRTICTLTKYVIVGLHALLQNMSALD